MAAGRVSFIRHHGLRATQRDQYHTQDASWVWTGQ